MPTRRDQKWWKERWVAGHYAELKSKALLAAHMEHKGYNAAALARVVTHERLRTGGSRGCSRQMISALLNTQRVNSCEPDLAAAIERVLDVPDHMLFDVLPKSHDKRETAKSGRAA